MLRARSAITGSSNHFFSVIVWGLLVACTMVLILCWFPYRQRGWSEQATMSKSKGHTERKKTAETPSEPEVHPWRLSTSSRTSSFTSAKLKVYSKPTKKHWRLHFCSFTWWCTAQIGGNGLFTAVEGKFRTQQVLGCLVSVALLTGCSLNLRIYMVHGDIFGTAECYHKGVILHLQSVVEGSSTGNKTLVNWFRTVWLENERLWINWVLNDERHSIFSFAAYKQLNYLCYWILARKQKLLIKLNRWEDSSYL